METNVNVKSKPLKQKSPPDDYSGASTSSTGRSAPPIVLSPEVEEQIYSATYVEDFVDACENLPPTVQKLISQVHELNIVQSKYMEEIKTWSDALIVLLGEAPDGGNDTGIGNGAESTFAPTAEPATDESEIWPPIEFIDLEPEDFDETQNGGGGNTSTSSSQSAINGGETTPPIEYVDLEPEDCDKTMSGTTLPKTGIGMIEEAGGDGGNISTSTCSTYYKSTIIGGETTPPIEFIDLEPEDFDETEATQSGATLPKTVFEMTEGAMCGGWNTSISTPKPAIDGDGGETTPIEFVDLEPDYEENYEEQGAGAVSNEVTISSDSDITAVYAKLEHLLVLNQLLSDEKRKLTDAIKEIVAFKLEQLDIDKNNLGTETM